MLLHDLHEESVFLLVKKLFFYFEVHQYVPDFLVLSGSCGKDMNYSSAKTVKFLGYKFHVKCRNLQSHDLYLLKSLFITCNIFYFFLSVQNFFFLLPPKMCRAERSHLENASGFLRRITKSERTLAVSKGYICSI